MKMTKNYLVYLIQDHSTINIKEILYSIKNEASFKYKISYKEEENRIVVSLNDIEIEDFFNISNKISKEFNYNIADFSLDSLQHMHIEIMGDDYEVLHSFTIYLTSDDTWEVYYTDGIFIEKLQSNKGSVTEETYFLFAKTTNKEENLESYFTSICENWVAQQSYVKRTDNM